MELRRELDDVVGDIDAGNPGEGTSDSSMCRAWPNSWNRMRTSSGVNSAGAPSAGRSVLSVRVDEGQPAEQRRRFGVGVHPCAPLFPSRA